MPVVHAVLVDFFNAPKVIQNVNTLTKQYPADKLMISVIDNSVCRKNAELLKSFCERKKIVLTINETNRGYTAACNQGVRQSNADYILFLNPDIYWPQSQSLEKLVEVMQLLPNVAICGPKQINPDGRIAGTIRSRPGVLELIRRRVHWLNLMLVAAKGRSPQFYAPDYSKNQAVDWLQSSCFLVRNSFWQKVGGFDERYFLFMADLDLCRKAWKLGYEVRYVADSLVHADGIRASAGGISAIFTKPALRSHIRDAIKYFFHYRSQPWP